jgi:hypothetical protein
VTQFRAAKLLEKSPANAGIGIRCFKYTRFVLFQICHFSLLILTLKRLLYQSTNGWSRKRNFSATFHRSYHDNRICLVNCYSRKWIHVSTETLLVQYYSAFPLQRLEEDCSHRDQKKFKQVSATTICWNCWKMNSHGYWSRVEAGSNTSTVTLRVAGGDEKGSLKSETLNYGQRETTTYTEDRPVLSSERAPHKRKAATVKE